MDDKKFNKIMEDYVSSTSGVREEDLKKLPEKPDGKKKYWGKFALYSTLAVIVLLLISLPILFSGVNKPSDQAHCSSEDKSNEEIQYGDSERLFTKSVENISQLGSYGISNFMIPQIEMEPYIEVYFYRDKPDEYIGARFLYEFLDQGYATVTIHVIHKNYKFNDFTNYDNANVVEWNGIIAKYVEGNYDIEYNIYETRIKFTKDDYDYFIDVETFGQIEPAAILDYIYN